MLVRRTISGERPGVGWVRVTRSASRPRDVADMTTAQLHAWSAALGEVPVFTHVTAAHLHGLWLPSLPDGFEDARKVVVQAPAGAHPVRRQGLRFLRTDATAPAVLRAGVRCASMPDVLLSLARDLSALDLVVALDSALAARLTTREAVDRAASASRRGAPALRRALRWCDARSESPWETLLREFHRHVGVEVEPQFEVRDEWGAFVARGDLRVVGHRVLHEYDGHHHLEVGRQHADLRRARRLEAAGWVRRGYTAPDLTVRPHEILADLDRSLGRTPDLRRLDGWLAALGESSFSVRGRRRLHDRLV